MGKGNFEIVMTTWSKSDWKRFYDAARRPWRHRRPPRPVYPTGLHGVLPARGFSLSEVADAGVILELSVRLGLPADVGLICTYGTQFTGVCVTITHPRCP